MLKVAVRSSSAGHPDTHSGALWHAACGVDVPCSCSSTYSGMLCKIHLYRYTGVDWAPETRHCLSQLVLQRGVSARLAGLMHCSCSGLLLDCLLILLKQRLGILQQLWYSWLLLDRCCTFKNLTFFCSALEKSHKSWAELTYKSLPWSSLLFQWETRAISKAFCLTWPPRRGHQLASLVGKWVLRCRTLADRHQTEAAAPPWSVGWHFRNVFVETHVPLQHRWIPARLACWD